MTADEAAPLDFPAANATSTAGSWCAAKPVVEKYCTNCHDGEGTGGSPMGLTSPADFQKAAPISAGKKVFQVSAARIHDTARPMPPRAQLSSGELATLDAWLNAGAPAGGDCTGGGDHGGGHDPAQPSDGRVDGWDPTQCDEIYELRSHAPGNPKAPFSVSPNVEIHPQIAITPPWGNERVQMIGVKPITDNKKVLHHWILYGNGFQFLAGWAPGDDSRPPLPPDVGQELPNRLRLDMHYFNKGNARAEQDRSGLAVCVLKRGHLRPKTAVVTMGFTSIGPVLAPAFANNRPSTGTCRVVASQPVHLLTAAPHAHKLATRMRFVVKKRSGQTLVMHDKPFNFGEQGTYPLPGGEVVLNTGDVVTTSCYYTNPTARAVTIGESTTSEMCFNFALYYPKGALSCVPTL